jgi:nitrate/TMAO reductase-like tetraheme cytochrome c subunit
MFTESFLGKKSAKIDKEEAVYETLEKRQSKDNRLELTFEVLETAKIIKKAEGVNCHKFDNIPAQKICLHVHGAHGEDHRQAVQQLQELLLKPW